MSVKGKNPVGDIIEGIVAISSLAVVAERIIDKMAAAQKPAPSAPLPPTVPNAERVAGDDEEAEPPKKKKKTSVQIEIAGQRGFYVLVKHGSEKIRCLIDWGKFSNAIGEAGLGHLADAAEREAKKKKEADADAD